MSEPKASEPEASEPKASEPEAAALEAFEVAARSGERSRGGINPSRSGEGVVRGNVVAVDVDAVAEGVAEDVAGDFDGSAPDARGVLDGCSEAVAMDSVHSRL